jgi:hypothetical protein
VRLAKNEVLIILGLVLFLFALVMPAIAGNGWGGKGDSGWGGQKLLCPWTDAGNRSDSRITLPARKKSIPAG